MPRSALHAASSLLVQQAADADEPWQAPQSCWIRQPIEPSVTRLTTGETLLFLL
jgi:hypothetical protein